MALTLAQLAEALRAYDRQAQPARDLGDRDPSDAEKANLPIYRQDGEIIQRPAMTDGAESSWWNQATVGAPATSSDGGFTPPTLDELEAQRAATIQAAIAANQAQTDAQRTDLESQLGMEGNRLERALMLVQRSRQQALEVVDNKNVRRGLLRSGLRERERAETLRDAAEQRAYEQEQSAAVKSSLQAALELLNPQLAAANANTTNAVNADFLNLATALAQLGALTPEQEQAAATGGGDPTPAADEGAPDLYTPSGSGGTGGSGTGGYSPPSYSPPSPPPAPKFITPPEWDHQQDYTKPRSWSTKRMDRLASTQRAAGNRGGGVGMR